MAKALSIRNWDLYFENPESRKVKHASYVCLPNKHDGKGFSRIAMHKKSCRVFTGWSLILQVASKMPQRGLLVDEDGALDVDDLAAMTRFDSGIFADTIAAITDPKIGWAEWVDLPEILTTSGRNPEEIPVRPDATGRDPDMSGRTEQNRTEQKIPPNPLGGDGVGLDLEVEETPRPDPVKERLGGIYKRRGSTQWSKDEEKALKALRIDSEGLELVEAFHAVREREGQKLYRRTSLLTLLRHWTEEVDKARSYFEHNPRPAKKKASGPPPWPDDFPDWHAASPWHSIYIRTAWMTAGCREAFTATRNISDA